MKPLVSDETLRHAVIKELEDDPEVIAKHIWVTAIDGAVTHAGHVMTIHEKHVAMRAAERVEAVRAEADEIEVRAPALHERADDEIAEEIAHPRPSPTIRSSASRSASAATSPSPTAAAPPWSPPPAPSCWSRCSAPSCAGAARNVLNDPRVIQFWDGDRIAGKWFADKQLGGLGGPGSIGWDAYYAFPSNSTWTSESSGTLAAGSDIIDNVSGLEHNFIPLLHG